MGVNRFILPVMDCRRWRNNDIPREELVRLITFAFGTEVIKIDVPSKLERRWD